MYPSTFVFTLVYATGYTMRMPLHGDLFKSGGRSIVPDLLCDNYGCTISVQSFVTISV